MTLRKIPHRLTSDDIGQKVHAVILAGGSQDNPLARYRAMPAMEIGALRPSAYRARWLCGPDMANALQVPTRS